jgi:hypothetical protein
VDVFVVADDALPVPERNSSGKGVVVNVGSGNAMGGAGLGNG